MRVQISRPRLGHGSDVGGRRTPWIVGGMAVLGLGGIGAAACHRLDGDPSLGRVRARGRFVSADRPRCGGGRHHPACAAGKARGRAAACRRGHDRVGDDDRRIHRHHRDRRPFPRPVFADPASNGCDGCFGAGDDHDAAGSPRRRRAGRTSAQACRPCGAGLVPRRALRGLGRPEGAALRDLCLRLDAGLQRAGSDPRAIRWHGLWLYARRIDETVQHSARRRAHRHAAGGAGRKCHRRCALRIATGVDHRRLRRVHSGAGEPCLGRTRRPVISPALDRSSYSASPMAPTRSPRSAR